jgi:collagenase-like PrtC family protease
MMDLEIGHRRFDHVIIEGRQFPFTTFEEVSRAYRRAITALDLGASETPLCEIFDGAGRKTAYISYNGRAWEFDPADPFGTSNTNRCLYDPRPGPGPGALPPERMAA